MNVAEKVKSKSASPFRVASVKPVIPLDEIVKQFGAFQSEEPMTKDEFLALIQLYPELRMEREKNGKVTIMSPVKKGSARREMSLHGYLFIWWHSHKKGEVYSSSGGFDLPDGATKSPDAAWVSPERVESTEQDEEAEFVKSVPDFICEIRSWSDGIGKLRQKMKDVWMANGVRLGWLIDPYQQRAIIYRQGKEVEIIKSFDGRILSGEDVLEGFTINLEDFKVKKRKV